MYLKIPLLTDSIGNQAKPLPESLAFRAFRVKKIVDLPLIF